MNARKLMVNQPNLPHKITIGKTITKPIGINHLVQVLAHEEKLKCSQQTMIQMVKSATLLQTHRYMTWLV